MVEFKEYNILKAIFTSCYTLILFLIYLSLLLPTSLIFYLFLYLTLAILFILYFLVLVFTNL
jgi:hypothetical protein